MDAKAILKEYPFKGEFKDCYPIGEGHINQTMLAVYSDGKKESKYVLQRINDNLFKDVDKLMNNILLVTEFIKSKAETPEKAENCLTVIKTADGRPFVRTEDGYYRIYRCIDGVSYQVVENAEDFYRCAYAFGKFAKDLSDFDASSLFEVIPKFHDTEKRFTDFKTALEKNEANRADGVKKEIDFVLKRCGYCGRITGLLKSGEIPLRVTHNDTKLNNVMFDGKTGEVLAVIDLDTVMPGSLCYDFGDAIRFGCNTSTEDDTDLSRVNFDIKLFDAFTKGYLSAIGDGITKKEKENLAFSAILMTYECGMRFLADHLDGDKYFRISRENQNLDRARTQFKLIEDMERLLPEMERIVDKY